MSVTIDFMTFFLIRSALATSILVSLVLRGTVFGGEVLNPIDYSSEKVINSLRSDGVKVIVYDLISSDRLKDAISNADKAVLKFSRPSGSQYFVEVQRGDLDVWRINERGRVTEVAGTANLLSALLKQGRPELCIVAEKNVSASPATAVSLPENDVVRIKMTSLNSKECETSIAKSELIYSKGSVGFPEMMTFQITPALNNISKVRIPVRNTTAEPISIIKVRGACSCFRGAKDLPVVVPANGIAVIPMEFYLDPEQQRDKVLTQVAFITDGSSPITGTTNVELNLNRSGLVRVIPSSIQKNVFLGAESEKLGEILVVAHKTIADTAKVVSVSSDGVLRPVILSDKNGLDLGDYRIIGVVDINKADEGLVAPVKEHVNIQLTGDKVNSVEVPVTVTVINSSDPI